MNITICNSSQDATNRAATIIQSHIAHQPRITLGLATGRTMEPVYDKLAQSRLSFAEVTSFNLDEYIGLPKEHPQSYHRYMRDKLFMHTDIRRKNTFLPDGMIDDRDEAANAYESAIRARGGIDIQLLGIGTNGHIGFNEPFSSYHSHTRDVELAPQTREQNAQLFGGDINAVPKYAITMGVSTIMRAKSIILLAVGEDKSAIIAQALEGPVTPAIPASILQTHKNAKIILDQEAARNLSSHHARAS